MGESFQIKPDDVNSKYDTDDASYGLAWTKDGKTGNVCVCVQRGPDDRDEYEFTDEKEAMTAFEKARYQLLIANGVINREFPEDSSVKAVRV